MIDITDIRKQDADRRRARLAELLRLYFDGQKAFIDLTGINQGELSALLKDKSFGGTKARKLEGQAGLLKGSLDAEVGSPFYEKDAYIKSLNSEAKKKSHMEDMFADLRAAEQVNITAGPERRLDKNVTPTERRRVPVISYVQAGMMSEVVDPFVLGDGFEMVDAPAGCSARTFGLRIEGNSMEPRFHDGDTVVIDPSLAPRPGDFVVGKNGKEEATFKKYLLRGIDENGHEVFELAPLNEDYPTLHSQRDGLRIIGVCVGRWEMFRSL